MLWGEEEEEEMWGDAREEGTEETENIVLSAALFQPYGDQRISY